MQSQLQIHHPYQGKHSEGNSLPLYTIIHTVMNMHTHTFLAAIGHPELTTVRDLHLSVILKYFFCIHFFSSFQRQFSVVLIVHQAREEYCYVFVFMDTFY